MNIFADENIPQQIVTAILTYSAAKQIHAWVKNTETKRSSITYLIWMSTSFQL
jgi:hypothetical protein